MGQAEGSINGKLERHRNGEHPSCWICETPKKESRLCPTYRLRINSTKRSKP
jgi:hypothetical protein